MDGGGGMAGDEVKLLQGELNPTATESRDFVISDSSFGMLKCKYI